MFDVSRTVVRQALGDLASEGLITRSRGRGTFVAEPKIEESLVQKLTGFYEDMVERGYQPETEVLEQTVIPASQKVADFLHIGEGTPVFKLGRKRSIQGEPILLVTTYISHSLCNGLEDEDFEDTSLYQILEEEYGLVIAYGRRTVEAVPANRYEADLLEVKKGAPLVLLDSISFLDDGTPLEYYHAVHRGDRTRFEVELVRYPDRGDRQNIFFSAEEPPRSSAIITGKLSSRTEEGETA